MDWFSETDWAEDGWVLRNVRLCARAARIGRCVGVCFDPEPFWGRNPWKYEIQPGRDQHTFEEFQTVVRQRGRRFMTALQSEFPGLTVHTFFLVSDPRMFDKAKAESDPAKRNALLKQGSYALWPAFIAGMLDTAAGGTTLTDGNEYAYYYRKAGEYAESVTAIRSGARPLFDDGAWVKYRKHVQVAQAVYVDLLCNLLPTRGIASNLSPVERAQWLEHNVYNSLKFTDRYVWLYTEHLNWWTGANVPEYAEAAILSAREKLATRRPPGFDLNPAIGRAWRELCTQNAKGITPPEIALPRRADGLPAPAIDGRLDDAIWQTAVELPLDQTFIQSPDYTVDPRSRVHLTCDAEKLYVGFQFGRVTAATRLALAVVMAPDRQREDWCAFTCASDPKNPHAPIGKTIASRVKPGAVVAAQDDGATWIVEMAIPWSAWRSTVPNPNERIAANVVLACDGPAMERYLQWSLSKQRAIEPAHLGTWILR